jgi:hypothetical protein
MPAAVVPTVNISPTLIVPVPPVVVIVAVPEVTPDEVLTT